MDQNVSKVVEEALRLPPEARAALIGKLIESLDDGVVDEGAEAAWGLEISRRLEDVDSGRVKPVAWADARRQIFGVNEPTKP